MSRCRRQVVIDAPLSAVWELVGDPNRHPAWWPRVLEVECDDFGQGCTYRQVTRGLLRDREDTIVLEHVEDFREVRVRCLETGTYMRWVITGAQGATFVDAEFGCDPATAPIRAWDAVAGRRYFRRWMDEAVQSLREAAGREQPAKRL